MKTVIAAALGECVHVAGVSNFLRLAEAAGWRTVFLGPAVPIEQVLDAAKREKADLVGVSYRLTPETGERLLGEFAEAAGELHDAGVRFAFGGTPPVAERARALGFFERMFDGSEPPEAVLAYLKGQSAAIPEESDYPQTTVERIRWKSPFPLLRHHFGLPTLEATLHGHRGNCRSAGAGRDLAGHRPGCPGEFLPPRAPGPAPQGRRRRAGALAQRITAACMPPAGRAIIPCCAPIPARMISSAWRRCTSRRSTIAWCAIPLFWFNQMDGRGPWDLEGSIREHQQVMAWYGARGIPVELNEPHHWGMRDAPDVVFVVSAYLSAYNARAFGVKDYIAQMMFNSPPGLSDAMDLAKMLAVLDLIEPLESAGLSHLAADAHRLAELPARSRMRPARTWLPASTCRWRSSRTSCMSSGTPRPTTPPPPRT